jgi:hypothetical protein
MSVVIPYDFATKKVHLSWREVVYALSQGIFSPASAIEHAMEELRLANEYPQSLVDLASLNKGESIHPYVDELADSEPTQPVEYIRDKWLYLILAWVFEQKDRYSDPLKIVEQIYADFNYPESIAHFVRYMPSNEPDLGSLEKNEARIFEKWKMYTHVQGKCFMP